MDSEQYVTIRNYVIKNPIATLGTCDAHRVPHGAAVYMCTDTNRSVVYFITKQDTAKYRNLKEHEKVSITIVNPSENSTLQAGGRAYEVEDAITIDEVMKKIASEHDSAKDWLPPIAKLRAGAYVIIGIELTHARLAHYQGMVIGDEQIFTTA